MSKRKKSKWKTDPLTGMQYERGSLMDMVSKSEKESKSSGKWIWEMKPEEGSPADVLSKGIKGLSNILKKKELKKTLPERTNQVWQAIEEFKPAKEKLKHEYNYQLNLHGYLKAKFPSAVIEKPKGSSRPDIVIDDIAIEIKGPTRENELKTIADKCMRYPQHFNNLIIVLFEVEVNQRRYDEWIRGMKRTFPQAIIIRK